MTEFVPEDGEAFRAQFVVGRNVEGLGGLGWGVVKHHGYDVWSCPDLPVKQAGVVCVLGYAAPLSDSSLEEHFAGLERSSSLGEVAERVMDLAGRFVVCADLEAGFMILVDGMGTKRVFLSDDSTLASSSEMLLHSLGAGGRDITPNDRSLVAHPSMEAREFYHYGLTSPVSGFRRLLPNRVANLTTGAIDLWSPATDEVSTSVPAVADLLRRNARAFSKLGELELGLTGGFDSRLILAAFEAEGIDVATFTFTDGRGAKAHDTRVAKQLASAVGYEHVVIEEPAAERHIGELLKRSQMLIRTNPHVLSHLTWLSHRAEKRLTISGMGGEIARSRYGFVPSKLSKDITRRITLGHDALPHDFDAFDEWWADRMESPNFLTKIPASMLHYWEQRMAIWGSQFNTEKDLFADEIPGFASGRLQQHLTSFPFFYRSAPVYHKAPGSSLFLDLVEELSPRLARLAPPEQSTKKLIFDATPLPRAVRTLKPGWNSK